VTSAESSTAFVVAALVGRTAVAAEDSSDSTAAAAQASIDSTMLVAAVALA